LDVLFKSATKLLTNHQLVVYHLRLKKHLGLQQRECGKSARDIFFLEKQNNSCYQAKLSDKCD